MPHKDKVKRLEYQRNYRKNHLNQIHAWQKKYSDKNREEINRKGRERERKFRLEHLDLAREKIRIAMRKQRLRRKMIIFRHYSPELKCAICGFNDIKALQLDHINGGGLKHLRSIAGGSANFHNWIIQNNFPPILQILCANCNTIKRYENKELIGRPRL